MTHHVRPNTALKCCGATFAAAEYLELLRTSFYIYFVLRWFTGVQPGGSPPSVANATIVLGGQYANNVQCYLFQFNPQGLNSTVVFRFNNG